MEFVSASEFRWRYLCIDFDQLFVRYYRHTSVLDTLAANLRTLVSVQFDDVCIPGHVPELVDPADNPWTRYQ
jgi:hypothetical protein